MEPQNIPNLGDVYQHVCPHQEGHYGTLFRVTGSTTKEVQGVLYVPLSRSFKDMMIVSFPMKEVQRVGVAYVKPMPGDIGMRDIKRAA